MSAWLSKVFESIFYFFRSEAFIIILSSIASLSVLVWIFIQLRKIRARRISRLIYTRSFSDDGVYAGDTVTLTEVISNQSFLPLFRVDIGSYFPGSLVPEGYDTKVTEPVRYFRSRFNMPPYSRITRIHRVTCTARGVYRISTAEIYTAGDYVFLDAPAEIYVYPFPVSDYGNMSLRTNMTGEFPSLNRFMPDPFMISGIRPFVNGDPMNSVNFKASAHTLRGGSYELMVNSHDSSAQFNIMIYYDFTVPRDTALLTTESSMLAELGLSYCSAMLEQAITNGGRAGFASNAIDHDTGKYIHYLPDGSRARMNEILRSMAAADISGNASFVAMLDADISAGGGLYDTDICILTFSSDDALQERVSLFRSMGRSVSVIVLPGR